MRRRTFITAGLTASAVGALGACAPGSPAPASSSAAPVATDIASLGTIELQLWDQEVRGSQNKPLETLCLAFHEKYPNITVRRSARANEDLQKQLALALSGEDVPDIAQVNNARGDMGQYVAAGQLLDLSSYAASYKWEERFPTSVLSKVRYSPDAKTFGEGSLYGLPQTGEVVGVFYSKQRLAALGKQVPTSWDEYFATLDAAKAAGQQAMVLGNIEKWPALHVFGPLQANFVEVDDIVKLGMGNAGASWVSDGNKQAMAQFAKWGAEGYFGSSPNGTDYDPAWAQFASGTGVFLPAGSWLATDLASTMGDDLGFFVLPALGGKLATTGGTGIPFAIPAKAKNQAAAAAFIDFITSDEAMKLIAEAGGMPVNKTAELAPAAGVQHDIFTAFAQVSENGTLLPYLDYATPSFADTAGAGLQEILGGQKSADDVLAAFEADYTGFAG